MSTETIEPKSSVNEAKSEAGLAASGGSEAADDYQPPTERDLEIQSLRCSLYQAATRYAQYVMGEKHDDDKAMRLSDELENAADAWASR